MTATTKQELTFSNPRLSAVFEDWPLGGSKRGRCVFSVEYKNGRGYRFVKQTTGKPKYHTYGGACAIVDGSDGRTYLLQKAAQFDFIKVSQHDFIDAEGGAAFPADPRFETLNGLIEQANGARADGGMK